MDAIKETEREDFALFRAIRREQYRREPYLLFETLRVVSQGEIRVVDGQVLDASGELLSKAMPHGLCLDGQIAEAMRKIRRRHTAELQSQA